MDHRRADTASIFMQFNRSFEEYHETLRHTTFPEYPRYHPILSSTRNKPSLSQLPLLIKQIRSRTSQINNLRTSIPILLQPRTIRTIISITNTLSTTNNTFP